MYQFEKLIIWRDSVEIIKSTYLLVEKFPKEERYSLSSQIQRAIVSVALNIAEGKGSNYDQEFKRFLSISIRSLHETVAGIKIAESLGYIKPEETVLLLENMEVLGAKIAALINTLKKEKLTANSQ